MNQTFNYPTWFFVCFVLSKFIFFLYFDMGGCNYKTSNMTALWVKLYGFRGQPWYKQKTSHILKSNIRKIGHQALLKASVFTRITCFLTHTSCPPHSTETHRYDSFMIESETSAEISAGLTHSPEISAGVTHSHTGGKRNKKQLIHFVVVVIS